MAGDVNGALTAIIRTNGGLTGEGGTVREAGVVGVQRYVRDVC
jgi:hypothetical protein